MNRTGKEHKKRIAEELDLYSGILKKVSTLFKVIDAFESDLKAIAEKEAAINKYPEIIKVNIKELTFNIRLQLEKSLDLLNKLSKTGDYLV